MGFVRTEVQGEEVGSGTAGVMAPVLYIDCEKEMSFYTVDLTLPEALFSAGQAEEKEFVLFLTVTEQIDDTDFNSVWNTEGTDGAEGTGSVGGVGVTSWDGLLVEPAAEPRRTPSTGRLSRAIILRAICPSTGSRTAYLPRAAKRRSASTRSTTTKTAGQRSFTSMSRRLRGGGFRVRRPSDRDLLFLRKRRVHRSFCGVLLRCGRTRVVRHLRERGCGRESKSGYIFFDGLSDDPYYDTYAEQQAKGTRKYSLSLATSKGYSTVLSVLFAQASESAPAGEGSA